MKRQGFLRPWAAGRVAFGLVHRPADDKYPAGDPLIDSTTGFGGPQAPVELAVAGPSHRATTPRASVSDRDREPWTTCLRLSNRGAHAGRRNDPPTREFQFGIKMPTKLVGTFEDNLMNIGGVDGTRTRDPRRDRPVF